MSLPEATIGSDSFRIDLRSYDEGLIIVLAGEFDLAGVPRFEQAVETVNEAGPAHVVVDFTALQFIDSSGISAIVELMTARAGVSDRLRACGIRGQVERVLELVGVDERLALVERPAEARPWPHES
jgi:anti-sigma B factor antagonist